MITVDDRRQVFEFGAVAVTGDRIVAVGTVDDLAHFHSARTIDALGMAVLPGFIDTHQHLFQFVLRGLGEAMELWPWLSGFMWPVSTSINPAEATIGTQLGAVEAVKSGVTTVLDNHYAPTDVDTVLSVAAAIEEVGPRGAVARSIFGPPTDMAIKHGLAAELFRDSAEEESSTSPPRRAPNGKGAGSRSGPLRRTPSTSTLFRPGPGGGDVVAYPRLGGRERSGLLPRGVRRPTGRLVV